MSTHLAAAVQATTTSEALRIAESILGMASLVEYRLDLMTEFDVGRLIDESPIPAIITCRPQREGGRYSGSEASRIAHLRAALAEGAFAVDVEADTLWQFRDTGDWESTIIGSRHDFEGMLGDWATSGTEIRAQGGDIAKLVGTAAHCGDVLTPFVWLSREQAPAIAIVMGSEGGASRLLSSRFDSAWLTFVAAATETAPGQTSIADACERYRFSDISAADNLFVWLTPPEVPWDQVERFRCELNGYSAEVGTLGAVALVPIPLQYLDARFLLALRLAGVRGILREQSVRCSDNLQHFGLNPNASCYRFDGESIAGSDDDALAFRACLDYWLQI